MLEVVFNASAEGSLKAFIASGGLKEDRTSVVSMCFMMDIGELKPGITSKYRINLPTEMIMYGSHEQITEAEKEELGRENLQNWKILKVFLTKGEPVRIWYGHNPEDYCGLLHVSTLLEEYENAIYLVKCPEVVKDGLGYTYVQGFGQMQPKLLSCYTDWQYRAEKEELRLLASQWDKLVEENAPLRAVINHQVVSVPEDFYDFLIRRQFPVSCIKQADLIGDIMDQSLGVQGFWLRKRIQKLIELGEMEVVENSARMNERLLSTIC